jgi:hypothetical protein
MAFISVAAIIYVHFSSFCADCLARMGASSLLLPEKNKERKNVLMVLLGTGILLALYYGYCLIFYSATASIADHHIAL